MSRAPQEEFGWKIITIALVWSAFLFPGYLMGPALFFFGWVPVLADVVYLLTILGGIIFGVWGGVLSPALACLATHILQPGMPVEAVIISGLLQLVNGTAIPWIRSHIFSGLAKPDLRGRLAYLIAAFLLVPFLNGLYYALFGSFHGYRLPALPIWKLSLLLAAPYTLLWLFPGLLLVRFIAREARRVGFFLENRWSLWSWRTAHFHRVQAALPAVLLVVLPFCPVAVKAWAGLQQRQASQQDRFIMNQLLHIQAEASRLNSFLTRKRDLLDTCLWNLNLVPRTPDDINNFLLPVLKSDPDLLNLEFVPQGTGNLSRFAYFLGAGTTPGVLKNQWQFVSTLRPSASGSRFFVLGRRTGTSGNGPAGWIFLRCSAARIERSIEQFRNRLPADTRILLTDNQGRAFFGYQGTVPLQKDRSRQEYVEQGRVRTLLFHLPLLGGEWELVCLEREAAVEDNSNLPQERALWSLIIHISTLALLLGIAFMFRLVP